MPYTLYSHPGSGGFAVEAGLTLAGQDVRTVLIDTKQGKQFSESFRAINPWCQVPALQLPDGTLMTESAAMVIHIADAFPEAGLAPTPGSPAHADFLRWIVFMTINIYEGDLRGYYPERYTTDPAGADGVAAAGFAHMQRGLQTMEDVLADRPFVLGGAFSLADIYLAMVRAWYRPPFETPNIGRVTDAVRSHPQIAPLWQAHFPDR